MITAPVGHGRTLYKYNEFGLVCLPSDESERSKNEKWPVGIDHGAKWSFSLAKQNFSEQEKNTTGRKANDVEQVKPTFLCKTIVGKWNVVNTRKKC